MGFLNALSPDIYAHRMRVFHRGLKEAGYVKNDNAAIEYRWADNQMDRLPAMAADLVRKRPGRQGDRLGHAANAARTRR